jgi:hypothetical protein
MISIAPSIGLAQECTSCTVKIGAWNIQEFHPLSKMRVPEPVVAQKCLDADVKVLTPGHRGT